MFVGSIPPALRSLIREVEWPKQLYIGCSGNFTIERALSGRGLAMHSNDVSLYSCALGHYFAGTSLPVAVSAEWPEFDWLSPYLTTPADTAATVMLGTEALVGIGTDNPYFARQREGYRIRWAELHKRAVDHLPALSLASFSAADVMDFVQAGNRRGGFVSFPPNYKGGYEAMYKNLEAVFVWDPPAYAVFDPSTTEELLKRASRYRTWLLLGDPGLDAPLVAKVQITNRARPLHVYGNADTRRLVQPEQELESVPIPPLGPTEEISGPLGLATLTIPQFAQLRSEYLDPTIPPAMVKAAWAVVAGDRVLGCFGYNDQRTRGDYGPMGNYLMSDFAVGPTRYPRLSRLVLMAALSTEARLLLERIHKFPVTEVYTSAFSDHPSSMKYRGLMHLARRVPFEEGYRLDYFSAAGRWTLQEALEQWLPR